MGPRAKSWLFLVSRERCRNSSDGEAGGATAWPARETLRPSLVDGIDCLRIVLARVPAKADPGSHLREVKLSTTRRGARALLLDHLRKEIGSPGKCGPSAVVTSRRARCHCGAPALRRPLRGARRWLVQSSPSFGPPAGIEPAARRRHPGTSTDIRGRHRPGGACSSRRNSRRRQAWPPGLRGAAFAQLFRRVTSVAVTATPPQGRFVPSVHRRESHV